MTHDLLRLGMTFLGAFGLVAASLPLARKWARKAGFVDRPGGRKDHGRETPPVGGLMVFPIAIAITSLMGGIDLSRDGPFLAALGMILMLGFLDDARGLPAGFKFAVQVAAAALIVGPGGAVIHGMGDLFGFGQVHPGPLAVPLSIFCVVLLINALNMIDGVDGLAGGTALAALVWILIAASFTGSAAHLALPLAGAVCGFLVYNARNPWRRKACVFLGDSGSMGLGLTLAWLLIHASQGPDAILSPVGVAWIVGVPVMDAFALFVTRASRGRHPFSADRRHFHHRFADRGVRPGAISAALVALSVLFGAVGVLGIRAGLSEPLLMGPWIVLLGANTAHCLWHRSDQPPASPVKRLKGLKPANDADQPMIDSHRHNGDKDPKLQRNP